ncbi:DEAD-domain-containing protein [Westerdykella ornata]|uniref:ATP-dependent RNA helicase n=1 Tax=Westerdykella ornata TaxID=318751 RepID=A0A6A6JK65_WESOR|nr:DEAD-domain-containing protein [Westerdykella ornata]KAF2275279.1 DEAD-domain-containing protein [Westerdykella ornata]
MNLLVGAFSRRVVPTSNRAFNCPALLHTLQATTRDSPSGMSSRGSQSGQRGRGSGRGGGRGGGRGHGRGRHPYRPRKTEKENEQSSQTSRAQQIRSPTGDVLQTGDPFPTLPPPPKVEPPTILRDECMYMEMKEIVPIPVDPNSRPFSSLQITLGNALLQGLDNMGFKYMSPVQEKVLTELPSYSSDCLVQAKTGTGKTAAFLLPAIVNLLRGNRPPRGKVAVLAICPTRELALQIAKECEGITEFLPDHQKMECHTAYGGTGRASSLNKFLKGNPTIVVATPGRLADILGEEEVREKFDSLKTLVLDEADQMLDQGFAPDIKKILKYLPPKSEGWQGMCFSATLPPNVKDVVNCVLFPGYISLSTIDKNEAPTVDRVPQFAIEVPTINETFAVLLALIETEYKASPQDFKAIVFGTTANGVGLLYDLYKAALPQFRVFELHSRMSQPNRTRTTDEFKAASSGILFASDVVGRGMDFPNVGLVIQLGLPASAEQYIHRVGRTARAGRDGRAVMVLFQYESFFIKVNKSLPIGAYPTDLTTDLQPYQERIDRALTLVDEETKARAYQAFLGYYKTFLQKLRLDVTRLVRLANQYAKAMGCPEPPLIEKRIVTKMGLKSASGLRIGSRKAGKE